MYIKVKIKCVKMYCVRLWEKNFKLNFNPAIKTSSPKAPMFEHKINSIRLAASLLLIFSYKTINIQQLSFTTVNQKDTYPRKTCPLINKMKYK